MDVVAPEEHLEGGRRRLPTCWSNRKVSSTSTRHRCCGWNNVKSKNYKHLTNVKHKPSKHCPLHCSNKGLLNFQWLEAEKGCSKTTINDTDGTETIEFSRRDCRKNVTILPNDERHVRFICSPRSYYNFTRRKNPDEEKSDSRLYCCNCKSKKVQENLQLQKDESDLPKKAPDQFPKVSYSDNGLYNFRNYRGKSICIPCKREKLNDDYASLAGENASKTSEEDQLAGNTSFSERTSTITDNKTEPTCICGKKGDIGPQVNPRPRRPWTSVGDSKFPVLTKIPGNGGCCVPVTEAESYLALLRERLRLKESLKRLRLHLEKQTLQNRRLRCQEKVVCPETTSSGEFSGGSSKNTAGEGVQRGNGPGRSRICRNFSQQRVVAEDPDNLEILYSCKRSNVESPSRNQGTRHCPI